MCGAAAESIVLALAIEIGGDEGTVIHEYLSAGGRGRIENRIVGRAEARIQREFRGYTELLKYWRDASAHGQAVHIAESEGFTSLATLLRFAQFAHDNWEVLTSTTETRSEGR
jgi:hypothetical protein